jgi:hypothetical protein
MEEYDIDKGRLIRFFKLEDGAKLRDPGRDQRFLPPPMIDMSMPCPLVMSFYVYICSKQFYVTFLNTPSVGIGITPSCSMPSKITLPTNTYCRMQQRVTRA